MIYYCISDIHGCLFAFQNALDIIADRLDGVQSRQTLFVRYCLEK